MFSVFYIWTESLPFRPGTIAPECMAALAAINSTLGAYRRRLQTSSLSLDIDFADLLVSALLTTEVTLVRATKF